MRAEGQKVTWPTRKETTVTTIMVFVMVFIASIFFLLADQVMRIARELSARHQLLRLCSDGTITIEFTIWNS